MQFEEEIRQLVTCVWESTLHLPIEAAAFAPAKAGRMLTGYVHITGTWPGVVAISCDFAMAADAARIMFKLDNSAPALGDMHDALGELTNMIGGNVKALLPEGCHLSLPSVVEGSDDAVRMSGSELLTQSPFRCNGHGVSVSLLKLARAA